MHKTYLAWCRTDPLSMTRTFHQFRVKPKTVFSKLPWSVITYKNNTRAQSEKKFLRWISRALHGTTRPRDAHGMWQNEMMRDRRPIPSPFLFVGVDNGSWNPVQFSSWKDTSYTLIKFASVLIRFVPIWSHQKTKPPCPVPWLYETALLRLVWCYDLV